MSYSMDDTVAPQADRSNTRHWYADIKIKKNGQTQLDNQTLQLKDDNRRE